MYRLVSLAEPALPGQATTPALDGDGQTSVYEESVPLGTVSSLSG